MATANEPGSSGSTARPPGESDEAEQLSLSGVVANILEEGRMILPGTQTLFGFQLMVVFNQSFQEQLSVAEEYAHLVATGLVLVAMAMLMTPAAYHRRAEPDTDSRRFVEMANRLLFWSLPPLGVAVSIDFYLVASMVTRRRVESVVLALAAFVLFAWLWFVLPNRAARERP